VASWSPPESGYEVQPDPRPAKRFKASKKEWAAIHEYFRGRPVLGTDEIYNPDEEFHCLHHIAFKKADSGDDVIENLAPLLTADHDTFHGRATGWEKTAREIRVYVLTHRDRCRYMKSKLTWERFNARYPLLSSPDGVLTRGGSLSGDESDWPDPRLSPWEVDPRDEIEGVEF
jgi:hypothetical protein